MAACIVAGRKTRFSADAAERDAVAVDIARADKDTIQTACTKGFPRPKEFFRETGPGKAYVPPGLEKKARFVIDLQTSKAVPEAEFGKP